MADPPYTITKWTFLMFQLIALIDAGQTLAISEVSQHIEQGDFFKWLSEKFPFPSLDLSVYEPGVLYPADEMVEILQRIDNVDAFDVHNNGLARLVAYAIQAIQQGE